MQRIYKGRICTEQIFHIFKIYCVFFLTLKVIVSSTQFFTILENFHIQKIIERLKNPNFKKQREDYRLNFDMKFWFLHFAAYFSIYIILKIWVFKTFVKIAHYFVTLLVASFIAVLFKIFNQVLWSTRKLPNQLK